MDGAALDRPYLRTIAFIGNYVPRQCGIATFTSDLLGAIAAEAAGSECWAMVMNDIPEGYPYPSQVRFELDQKNLSDYRLAADFLNMHLVDVVSLQHEFGIFGGANGAYILELIRDLRTPVVTTLHTVLNSPSPGQKAVMEELISISTRVVVMSRKGEEILRRVYGAPVEKIKVIHHGVPDTPFIDPNFYKDQFGVEGKKVILTFGLLSPGKGIEYMIEAMAEVVLRHPDAVYMVLGATHPHVRRDQGESYRLSLQRRARELGVEEHLIFHNRFVSLQELCEFLGAADIYVTPYLEKEQIVSGTLAYALAAGKATVSTPYWYAEEMLSNGRGRIVPFRDSHALAAAVIDLLDNEVERHAMRKRAYTFSRKMVWKEVARRYMELLSEVKRERETRPRVLFQVRTLHGSPPEIPQLKLDHLARLTDDVGLLQHAKFIVPDRAYGYCTDDNARALLVVVKANELMSKEEWLLDLACRYLGFLHYAFNEANGRFRNFMSYDRRWMEEEGSEDSHGRSLWALGFAVAESRSAGWLGAALNLFKRALPAVMEFTSPRAWAFALVGIHAYLRRFAGDTEVRRIRENLASRLFDLFQAQARDDWPWLEGSVTYANARIAQALILSGDSMQRRDMIQAGLRALEWLLQIQIDPKGHFVPIGNHGWYQRGGNRARFDQQPIEAQNMIEACMEAYAVTREERWVKDARLCFDWFLGRNDLNAPLYDYRTGGCCDGLTADGPNLNQGAESTLSWLLSLLNMHSLMESEAEPGLDMADEMAS
jgi:glycosyltransferase involved in cell wall biosynthesis